MKEIVQLAIEFGIQQERERAEFMNTLGLENEGTPPLPASQQLRLDANKIGDLIQPHLRRSSAQPAKPKAEKKARTPRQSGGMAAIKDALACGSAMTLAELVLTTGAKEGTVRAALRTLTAKGIATTTDGKWHSVSAQGSTNGAEAHSAAA